MTVKFNFDLNYAPEAQVDSLDALDQVTKVFANTGLTYRLVPLKPRMEVFVWAESVPTTIKELGQEIFNALSEAREQIEGVADVVFGHVEVERT